MPFEQGGVILDVVDKVDKEMDTASLSGPRDSKFFAGPTSLHLHA